MSENQRLWSARILIGVVFVWNVQCALLFLFDPGRYAPAFELVSLPGEAAVRGTGLLFLMWNIPYAVALSHPLRRRVSVVEAVLMQAVGALGESLILAGLPPIHAALRESIGRFLLFDGAGLLLLLIAAAIVFVPSKKN